MAEGYPKDFILYDVSHEEVYLTGSWCDWKPNAIKMTKIPNLYFIATVLLPYNTKVAYKYIVNGNWMTNPEEQSETDAAGNTNNVFTTPSESEAPPAVAPIAPHSSGSDAAVTGTSSTSQSAPSATAGSNTHHSGATEEIQEAKQSGVPVGAAVAGSGIAAAAAGTAVAAGLGKTEAEGVTGVEKVAPNVTKTQAEGVTGVEKVAPNVTQATTTSSGSGLGSEKDLAKPDLGSSTANTSSKAPLPASTADAPVAPGSATGEIEHKGLFSVIGGLAAGAASAATKAAINLEHKIEERFSESNTIPSASSNVVGASTTQAPVAGENMTTTAHAGALDSGLSSTLSNTSGAAASHKENPAAALDPIATNTGVSKITKEFAAVDFDHTKQEVVHAVERLGEVIAGGLTGIGAAHEGDKSVAPLAGMATMSSPAAAWPANTGAPNAGATSTGPLTTSREGGNTASHAQDGSSASAPTLSAVSGGPALYPADKSAPAPIEIDAPKTSTSQIHNETARDGAAAPALNGTAGGASTTVSGNTDATSGPATGASSSHAAGAASAATAGTAASAAAASPATGHSGHADKKQPSIIDDLKKGVKGGNSSATHAPTGNADAKGDMLGPPAVADHESHGLVNNNKKDTSTLGLPAIPTAASAKPPTTPKKTAAVPAGTTGASAAGTPNTPKTDSYNTAPSTPSGTPDDRKRKSSIFRKIKSALSPSK